MPTVVPSESFDEFATKEALVALFNSLQTFHHEHSLAMEERAKQLGLTNTGLRALVIIANSQKGTTTPSSLKNALHLTSGAVTTLLDKLVTAGCLRRIANTDDRRSFFVTLTPAGRTAVAELRAQYIGALLPFFNASQILTIVNFLDTGGRRVREQLAIRGRENPEASTQSTTSLPG